MCSLNFKKPLKWEHLGPDSYYDDAFKEKEKISYDKKENNSCLEYFFDHIEKRVEPDNQPYANYYSDYGDEYNIGNTGF